MQRKLQFKQRSDDEEIKEAEVLPPKEEEAAQKPPKGKRGRKPKPR